MHLSAEQRDAIDRLRGRALAASPAARARLAALLRAAGVTVDEYDAAVARVRGEGRVALAFHPERTSRSGVRVAHGLLADGVYRSQFETGLSSGSVTAYAGGERDEWERRLFAGAYHTPGAAPRDRPKYGALLLVAHPDGPAPRFGSCHLVLRPEVTARCTFTLLGSQDAQAQADSGTLDVIDPVMAALLQHVEREPAPLGVPGLTVRALLAAMRAGLPCAPPGVSPTRPGRALDSFVEAQVHGPIDLARDGEALVVDASFRGRPLAATLAELAATYDLSLTWTPGYTLAVADVPELFRDYPVRALARRIAGDGHVDAATLGEAANAADADPAAWRSFGGPSELRTCFRRLWHALVVLGDARP